jgi:hypothetical protein
MSSPELMKALSGDLSSDELYYKPGNAMTFEEEMEIWKQMALKYACNYKPLKKYEDNDEEADFDLDKYPVREWKMSLPFLNEPVAFNPVTSLIGVSCLWGLAIWCMSKYNPNNNLISNNTV